MLRNHPEIKGFTVRSCLTYVEVFYHVAVRGTKSYNAQAKQVPDDQKTLRNSMLMYSLVQLAFRHTANAGYVALPAAISGGLLPATLPGQR